MDNDKNIRIKARISNKDSLIYVCKNKPSYYTIDVEGTTTAITINYIGNMPNDKSCVRGELGYYNITSNGILFRPNESTWKDNYIELLSFQIKDEEESYTNITAAFVGNSICNDCNESNCDKNEQKLASIKEQIINLLKENAKKQQTTD